MIFAPSACSAVFTVELCGTGFEPRPNGSARSRPFAVDCVRSPSNPLTAFSAYDSCSRRMCGTGFEPPEDASSLAVLVRLLLPYFESTAQFCYSRCCSWQNVRDRIRTEARQSCSSHVRSTPRAVSCRIRIVGCILRSRPLFAENVRDRIRTTPRRSCSLRCAGVRLVYFESARQFSSLMLRGAHATRCSPVIRDENVRDRIRTGGPLQDSVLSAAPLA